MKSSAEYKSEAKQLLTGKWNSMIVATIIFLIFSIIMSILTDTSEYQNQFILRDFLDKFVLNHGLLIFLVSLIEYPLTVGYNVMALKCSNNELPVFNDLFSRFNIFGKIVLFEIIYNIGTLFLSLLLIFPGVYFAYTYCLVPIIFAENPEMSITEAMDESKRLINGHRMDFFLLQFSFIGWIILSGITWGLGLLYVLPYMTVTEILFYKSLKPTIQQNI